MTYDPTQPSATAEETVELEDGNRVSVRITAQGGVIVAGSFVSSPGYALKGNEVSSLPWEKAAKAARALERSEKGDEG